MILHYWNQLSKFPLGIGKWFFNFCVRFYVPYTGSIRPTVVELSKGYCRVQMHERRCLRNHLNSLHAAALMNLAEASSGIAFLTTLPPKMKSIVTEFRIEYKKKARGTITGECRCGDVSSQEEKKYFIEAHLKDQSGDTVAIGYATWFVRPA